MKKLVIAKMPAQEIRHLAGVRFAGKENEPEAVVSMLFSDNKVSEVFISGSQEKTRAGDVYVGHAERVLEKAGGVFVRFRKDETGYLPANRIRKPVFCNPKKDGRIKAGDEFLVRVETEKRANKQAVLNTALKGGKAFLEEITQKGIHRPCGTCLYRSPDPWKILFDRYREEGFKRVVTDDPEIKEALGVEAELYDDPMVRLFRLYGMSAVLEGLFSRKVWLDGGAYITIEQTEAFVCVDVNTAKTKNGADAEETNLRVNREALAETLRQIRCRGLSGTILIDLIPVKGERAKESLLSDFAAMAEKEAVYTKAVDITPLYIMEITRHKVKKPLKEQINEELS